MAEVKASVHIEISGDIVFELSPDPSAGSTYLLVSSKVLAIISPVFATIFRWDSRARERGAAEKNNNQSAPVVTDAKHSVISLPDDNMEAFILLCKVAHHKTSGISKTLEPDRLVEFATLCHKYDCVDAVALHSFWWLQAQKVEKSYDYDGLNRLLHAAYVLGVPEAFERISLRILLLHVGSILDLPGLTDRDLVPPGILAEFDAKHTKLTKLATDLMVAIQDTISIQMKSRCNWMFIAEDDEKLESYSLLPISPFATQKQLTSSNLLSFMHDTTEPMRQFCTEDNCKFCNKYRNTSFRMELYDAKEEVISKNVGLCLDRVITGRRSIRESNCRIKHA